MEQQIYITLHGFDMGKERLSLSKEPFRKLVVKAFNEGIRHADTKGRLKKYIDCLYLKHEKGNNIRIYGENVFIFHNRNLITVWQIPNEFKKYLPIFKK